MAENTNTLEQTPSFDEHFNDIEAMQKSQEAEQDRFTQEAAKRMLFEQPTQEPTTSEGSPIKNKLIKAGAGLALVAAGGAVGIGLGAQNAQALNDTKETVATDTIIPSQEHGDLIGPAMDAAQTLYEENGLNPNSVSYEDIQAELSGATSDHLEATGESIILPGSQFEVTLNSATGGILTGGAETHSIDITAVSAENKEEASADTPSSQQ